MIFMRKPDKKRFLNAVNHIESDEIPFFELEVDIHVVNQLLGKNFDYGQLSFDLPARDYFELTQILGNDMIYFSHVWRLGRKETRDEQGRRHYVDGTMKDMASLKDIWFPDMNEIRRRLEALLTVIDGTGLGLVCGAQTAAFTVPTAIGYQDFCMATYNNPEFIKEFQKRIHDYALRELEMYSDYPIDAVKIASGLITNNGSMISPDMMEIYEYPFLGELTGFLKEKRIIPLFHVDGFVEDLLERFIEMGARIINPVDPCSGRQDIVRIKKNFGDRIAIAGNIDIDGVLLNGTPEQVRVDVIEHIDTLSAGGGYIVCSSHDIHALVPPANVLAMRDAVHEYRPKQET